MNRKICDSCKNVVVKRRISTNTCSICSKVIVSAEIPEEKICIHCSEKYNKCIKCGKLMK